MPPSYTQTVLKTLNSKAIYKKNGTGTYYTMDPTTGAAKLVPLKTTVKNASGQQLVLSNHGKFTATNLTSLYGGFKIYKKAGVESYYTKSNVNGAMIMYASGATVKNSSGKTMTLGDYKKQKKSAAATPKPAAAPKPAASPKPAAATYPGFTKTNMKMMSASGKLALNVFKKNSNGTYHGQVGASLIDLMPSIILTKPNGSTVKVGDLTKANGANIPPGYTKTNMKFINNNVYKKNSNNTYWHKKTNGTLVTLPKEFEVTKPNGSQVKLKNLKSGAGPSTPTGYTKTNLKLGKNNIFSKNGKYYKKVPSGGLVNLPNYTVLSKPNGSYVKVNNLSADPKTPTGYTKTNLKFGANNVGFKNIYLKNGTYYTKLLSGVMHDLPHTVKLTKPNGTKVLISNLMAGAPPAPPGYTKVKNYTVKDVQPPHNAIYKHNSDGSLMWKTAHGVIINLAPHYKVLKPGAGKMYAIDAFPEHFLKGWTNTGKVSNNGKKVYKSNVSGKLLIVKNGKMYNSFAGMKKIQEALKGKAPATANNTPAPAGWVNTGKLSNNGKKVYKLGLNLGVMKNGKISKTFKGKAKLVKQNTVASVMAPSAPVSVGIAPVIATSLVPVIKPGPDHVKAVETKYVNSVTKVAEKLKELHEATGGNNTKNFNNYVAKRGNMGFAHMNRTNTIVYKSTTISGFQGGGTGWRKSLEKPHFVYNTRKVTLKYTQYLAHKQLLFVYGKNVNSFENVRMSDIIDTKWLVAQDKYIRSLSTRQIFTMYGYSFNGDSWAHAYLDGRFNFPLFKSSVPAATGNNYFAFFFQARDYYKINTGDVNKDYKAVIDRVTTEKDVRNIENIMNMFINELNEIIRKAPAVTRTFIVFRGQKDDKYMSGMIGNTYTAERFCSTSVDGTVSKDRFSGGHTLQRITVLRGSKCLLMFGATKFDDELEILLPRGSTYQIVKKRTNIKSYKSTNLLNPGYPESIQNLVDIVLIGTVEDAPVTAPAQVTVIPQTNVNIMQNIVKKLPAWGETKVTGLVGKGGYGAVYQASNNKLGNVAVKIQKKSNNSNAEIKALKKLSHLGIAPNYYNNKLIKASNNIAKLVPRGIAPGNNVSVIMSKMIRGNPLGKWYTGAPIPQSIKNKVKNVVMNMHSQGVIHGDLHKNNILIGNNGKAYVIDFGKSLVTNKNFKSTNEANNYLKKLTGKTKMSHSKLSWYSNNKRTHFLNGDFLRRMK
jgi:predicted Ser/Thr protein kinase